MIRSVVGDLVKKVRKEIKKKIPATLQSAMETPAAPPRPREQAPPPAPSGMKPPPQEHEPAKRKRRRRKKKGAGEQGVATANQAPQVQQTDADDWSLEDFQVKEEKGRFRFHDLDLPEQVMHAIHDLGFEYCTPIQAAALPPVLDGQDVFGKAQTGTGKTAAFLIAILSRLYRDTPPEGRPKGAPPAQVIGPPPELVMQLDKDAQGLGKYLPVVTMAVYGGM